MRPRHAVLVALLVLTAHVGAADYRALAGEYRIGGRTLVDAPMDEPRDTHLHLLITGSAARDIYRVMKTAPRADACENGTLVKSIGDMQCRRSGQRYECGFAIDIARQRISAASVC